MPDQFKIFDEVESFSRTERIATQIKKCLARELTEFFKSFGGGMLTITDVILSSDIKQAIYLSFYGLRELMQLMIMLTDFKACLVRRLN